MQTKHKNWEDIVEPKNVNTEYVWDYFYLTNLPEGCSNETKAAKCRKLAVCKTSPYCLNTITPSSLYKSVKDSKKELDKLKEINDAFRSPVCFYLPSQFGVILNCF